MFKRMIQISLVAALAVLIGACWNQPRSDNSIEDIQTSLSPTRTAEEEQTTEKTPDDEFDSEPTVGVETILPTYRVVDSGQSTCFDDSLAIPCPESGQEYYGQDAQYSGFQPAYHDNGNGTVTDLNTGLIWIQDAGDKVNYYEGIAAAENFEFAGFDDWRVPTIKELYSLMDFSGIDDADAGTDPFIDREYFIFQYGDESKGDRAIDSQWITSTIYVDTVMGNQECFFGVNFADGRIKCYPTRAGGNNGYFLRLVRGERYGENAFQDLGNGIIADLATGLFWEKTDSGEGMDWPSAMDYCEAASTGGQTDWRLPNAKELQSIVDYSRSPGMSSSPAIDTIFDTSSITNLLDQTDYPYFWTSTTHANRLGGKAAVYISFGRGMGMMNETYLDVHGAGSQRSDPKTGDPADFPTSVGPQGDIRRLYNYVRCVRGSVSEQTFSGGSPDNSIFSQEGNLPSGNQPTNGQGSSPDLALAAEILGVSVHQLKEALGPPPPDLAAAAAALGISENRLVEALGLPAGGPPPN